MSAYTATTSMACPLELCLATDDLSRLQHNVQLAASLGVSRLELCADMAQDGLTPALAAVALARSHWGAQPGVMAMLRPRGGDFCYSPAEIHQLLTLLPQLAAAGADAVVTGVLQHDASGQLQPHWQALAELSAAAQSAGLTFCLHRAIDACSDPLRSWSQLTSGPMAPARILSSGCHWQSADLSSSVGSAAVNPDGAVAGIQRLQQQLQLGGCELVVAGKVSSANLRWLRQQLQAVPLPAATVAAVPHHGSGQTQPCRFSFHLYSAVLRDGWVDPALLSAVLSQCHSPVA
jgi:copper homeostasis protein